jgi:hypothetical protein
MSSGKELHILRYALGLDNRGYGEIFQNQFRATVGTDTHSVCDRLVSESKMERLPRLAGVPDCYTTFSVSMLGLEFVESQRGVEENGPARKAPSWP